LTKKKGITDGSTNIKDSTGHMLTNTDKIRRRWKEYVEILYDKANKPKSEEMHLENECDVNNEEKGPDLLDSEILAAIKEMKDSKAVGVD
jgi:hypothetical protein